MMYTRNFLILAMTLCTLVIHVESGVACLACLDKCFALIAVPAAFIACEAMCAAMCISPLCFGSETKFAVRSEDEVLTMMDASHIKPGHSVQTLEDGALTWTNVTNSLEIEGPFDFVEITIADGTSISVTPEHIVVIQDQNDMFLISAKNLQIGHVLVGLKDALEVVGLKKTSQQSKVTISTEKGTALANGVLVSTICGDNIGNDRVSFEAGMNQWRKSHEVFFTRATKRNQFMGDSH